eukprot:5756188-Pyramimonas_sp.AAC.1
MGTDSSRPVLRSSMIRSAFGLTVIRSGTLTLSPSSPIIYHDDRSSSELAPSLKDTCQKCIPKQKAHAHAHMGKVVTERVVTELVSRHRQRTQQQPQFVIRTQ